MEWRQPQNFHSLDVLTLPLSGRHGALAGGAESSWWPVHSRGVLEETLLNKQRPSTFATK